MHVMKTKKKKVKLLTVIVPREILTTFSFDDAKFAANIYEPKT